MGVTIMNPIGSIDFPVQTLIGGVRWDRGFSTGVELLGQDLTASTRGGIAGAGTCVFPEVSQSAGNLYWEITWTGLQSSALEGGIGVIALDALGAVSDFAAFAADGTGGCLIRPNGDVYVDGSFLFTATKSDDSPLVQAEGDTVGLFLDMTTPGFFNVQASGVGGTIFQEVFGVAHIPDGTYMPVVAFGTVSVFDVYAATALFSRDNQGAFLGPTAFPDGFENITLGWPNHA